MLFLIVLLDWPEVGHVVPWTGRIRSSQEPFRGLQEQYLADLIIGVIPLDNLKYVIKLKKQKKIIIYIKYKII